MFRFSWYWTSGDLGSIRRTRLALSPTSWPPTTRLRLTCAATTSRGTRTLLTARSTRFFESMTPLFQTAARPRSRSRLPAGDPGRRKGCHPLDRRKQGSPSGRVPRCVQPRRQCGTQSRLRLRASRVPGSHSFHPGAQGRSCSAPARGRSRPDRRGTPRGESRWWLLLSTRPAHSHQPLTTTNRAQASV